MNLNPGGRKMGVVIFGKLKNVTVFSLYLAEYWQLGLNSPMEIFCSLSNCAPTYVLKKKLGAKFKKLRTFRRTIHKNQKKTKIHFKKFPDRQISLNLNIL